MSEAPEEGQEEATLPADYIKSNYFRVIHVDGVIGGITTRGLIHLDVWSERPPIPKHAEYRVIEGATASEIIERRVGRENVVIREVEAGLVLDIVLAKSLISWLQDRVNTLEPLLEKGHGGKSNEHRNAG